MKCLVSCHISYFCKYCSLKTIVFIRKKFGMSQIILRTFWIKLFNTTDKSFQNGELKTTFLSEFFETRDFLYQLKVVLNGNKKMNTLLNRIWKLLSRHTFCHFPCGVFIIKISSGFITDFLNKLLTYSIYNYFVDNCKMTKMYCHVNCKLGFLTPRIISI